MALDLDPETFIDNRQIENEIKGGTIEKKGNPRITLKALEQPRGRRAAAADALAFAVEASVEASAAVVQNSAADW